MTPSDRLILTAVHRWARTCGWRYQMPGWGNDQIRVCWGGGLVTVTRKDTAGLWPLYSEVYPVATVPQAVDVLVAIGVLPTNLSSAYEAGRYDWRGEVIELRVTAGLFQRRALRAEEDADRDARRADEAEKQRNEAERRLRAVRLLKVWRNEDGKDFVFADELWEATDPDIAALVRQAKNEVP